MTSDGARYAIYFAPPEGSALETFGRRFLGRDHITGETIDRPSIDGFGPDDLERVTRSARHYGFHATLKAPFELREGESVEALHAAARTFAAGRTAFGAPPLEIAALSRWVAFKLSRPSPQMNELAADCVRTFEPFRAPSSDADIEKRRKAGLTAKQDEQLLAFGYPYIFEDFDFHMTLAGPLDAREKQRLLDLLRPKASEIETTPLPVDAIALYEQADRDQPFIRTGHFPFRPS